MIVISDTSPIRAFHHLGLLPLLETLFGKVIVPPSVLAELAQQDRFANIDFANYPFIQATAPQDQFAVAALKQELDLGESEAIVLAAELKADLLLIDERHGRKIALSRGILTTGVLGILIRAKAKGLLPEVGSLALKLRNELGFHLTDAIIDEAKKIAGEHS